MHTEYLVVDDHAEGQKVKHVRKMMPHVGITIFPRALCIKSIWLCDASWFMITTNKMNAMRVSQFQTNKKGNRFDTEQASINVITWYILAGWTIQHHNLRGWTHLEISSSYLDRNHRFWKSPACQRTVRGCRQQPWQALRYVQHCFPSSTAPSLWRILPQSTVQQVIVSCKAAICIRRDRCSLLESMSKCGQERSTLLHTR